MSFSMPLSVCNFLFWLLQDPKNPAENILKGDGSKKWLSSSNDRSGKLECVIQLDRMCQISHIDIGLFSSNSSVKFYNSSKCLQFCWKTKFNFLVFKENFLL